MKKICFILLMFCSYSSFAEPADSWFSNYSKRACFFYEDFKSCLLVSGISFFEKNCGLYPNLHFSSVNQALKEDGYTMTADQFQIFKTTQEEIRITVTKPFGECTTRVGQVLKVMKSYDEYFEASYICSLSLIENVKKVLHCDNYL